MECSIAQGIHAIMIDRHMEKALMAGARAYPVLTVTGPRQSGKTVTGDFLKGIQFWRGLPGQENAPAAVVCGGETSMMRNQTVLYSWKDWL